MARSELDLPAADTTATGFNPPTLGAEQVVLAKQATAAQADARHRLRRRAGPTWPISSAMAARLTFQNPWRPQHLPAPVTSRA